jgi:hypothetical protein
VESENVLVKLRLGSPARTESQGRTAHRGYVEKKSCHWASGNSQGMRVEGRNTRPLFSIRCDCPEH